MTASARGNQPVKAVRTLAFYPAAGAEGDLVHEELDR